MRRLDAHEQLADMDVGVALRAGVIAVDGQTPLVASQLARLFDGHGPQPQPLLGCHGGERILRSAMRARKHEQAVGLARIDVLEEKVRQVGGLGFGLATEGAFPSLQRFRAGNVARASGDVGAQRRG